MTVLSSANGGGKASLAAVADWLVIAITISLPWSTSATAILAVLSVVACIPTLGWTDIRREALTAAGGLPAASFAFVFFKEWKYARAEQASALIVLCFVAFAVMSAPADMLYQRTFWLLVGAGLAVRRVQ